MVRMLLLLCVGMTLMGLTFGPMSAVIHELFPTHTRYTRSGMAYDFSALSGAALTPFVAVWLVQNHSVAYVGYYMVGLSMLTFILLVLAPETSKTSMYLGRVGLSDELTPQGPGARPALNSSAGKRGPR